MIEKEVVVDQEGETSEVVLAVETGVDAILAEETEGQKCSV